MSSQLSAAIPLVVDGPAPAASVADSRRMHRRIAAVGAALLAIAFVCVLVMGDTFVSYIPLSSQEHPLSSLTFEFGRDDVVELVSAEQHGDVATVTFRAVGWGKTNVYLVSGADTDDVDYLDFWSFSTQAFPRIVELGSRTFPGYRVFLAAVAAFFVYLTAETLLAFGRDCRFRRYSHHMIGHIGLGLFFAAASLLLVNATVLSLVDPAGLGAFTVGGVFTNAGRLFMVVTLPFLLSFAVLMLASNVALIRHEGMRPQNVLGIALAVCMLCGALVEFSPLAFLSGSEEQVRIQEAAFTAYDATYVYLECLLIGSVVCGVMAARNRPPLDRDAVVILGCAIRKDGGLFPLIQGRVDRAVEFYRAQEKATGKPPVLIPSGGKGPDEVVSEARAMADYLAQKGIPSSQVVLEDQSATTAENMRFSLRKACELFGGGGGAPETSGMPGASATASASPGRAQGAPKLAFSTTNYHVLRASILASEAGMEAQGMGSKTRWYFWPNAFAREFVGMLVNGRRLHVPLLVAFAAIMGTIAYLF